MYDGEVRVIGASKILRDITAEVELENRLMQSNLDLQRSDLYKDEFIALLGHELKTPLSSLMANNGRRIKNGAGHYKTSRRMP